MSDEKPPGDEFSWIDDENARTADGSSTDNRSVRGAPIDGDGRKAGSNEAAEAFEQTRDDVSMRMPATAIPDDPTGGTPADHAAELRDGYGRLRTFFKQREARFAGYRRRLNQARLPVTYDVYLTSVVQQSLVAGSVGVLIGLAIGTGSYAFAGWSPVIEPAVAVLLLAILMGVGVTATAGLVGYYRPVWIARRRRARIERALPHGVAYLYALTYGGLDVFGAIRTLAKSPEEYGDLAREFETVVIEVDHLGAAPLSALETLHDRTPSESLALFLEDLTGTIESGGNVTQFLSAETQDQFERARRKQDAFLEEVSLYAELYVGVLVVGPIFAVIVLLVVSIAGGGTLAPLVFTVYVGVPVGTVVFLWVTMRLTSEYGTTRSTTAEKDLPVVPETLLEDPRLEEYRNDRSHGRFEAIRAGPIEWLFERPIRSLVVTVPVAALWIGVAVLGDIVDPAAMYTDPVPTTALLVVVSTLIVSVPLGALHELEVRRSRAITRDLPGVLGQLAGANQQGLTLSEGLQIVARRTEGPLGEELKRTANDINWGAGVAEAFDRLRNRVRIGVVGRTVALLTDASRYSGDLHRVIDVAARDTASAQTLAENRRSEAGAYVAVVLVSFALYLFMLAIIDAFFVARIATLPVVDLPDGVGGQDLLIGGINPEVYRGILLHATLIQGFCAGLVAGELGAESWMTGLKYSILLVLVTMAVFGGLAAGGFG